jgi:hypothetical protein
MRGKPSWWDILVDDLDVAQRFFSAVFGWTFPISGPDFVVVFDGTEQVGQLYASSEQVSGRGIRMYFDTDDLEGILRTDPDRPGDGLVRRVHRSERGHDRPPHQRSRQIAQQRATTPCRRAARSPTGCAGRCGGADNRPAPAPATTTGKPTDHEDHDLRLEY